MDNFFYNMNQKLADIAGKAEQKQLNEGAKPDFLDVDKDGNKKETFKQAVKDKTVEEGSEKWIQKAIKKPGALHAQLGVPQDEKIPAGKLAAAAKKGGKLGQRARLAQTLGKLNKEGVEEAGVPMTPKQKSFAKLAPPADKITFADKIAGAKKEVDEMLGDVAAEAIKDAVGKTRKVAGTRYGGAAQRDDDAPVAAVKKGRGRPKKGADSDTGEVMKPDWSAFGVKQGKDVKLPAHKGAVTKHKLSDKEPGEKVKEADESQLEAAIKMLKKAGYKVEKAGDELEEKAVSKKQQKFMGMVHAAQKGEKPASKEVAKVAKEMPKKAAKDFASTKHKGLPEKAPKKKEEGADNEPKGKKKEVEETTTSGSVAPSTAGKASSKGGVFGKGIYDSYNRAVEGMISESMSVNLSMNSDAQGGPSQSLTVTATDEDATMLSELLRNAGIGHGGEHDHGHDEPCETCGMTDCGCGDVEEAVAETQADWPTEPTGQEDNINYYDTDGLNGRKSTGQTTVPVIASQTDRQGAYEGVDGGVDGVGDDHGGDDAMGRQDIYDSEDIDEAGSLLDRIRHLGGIAASAGKKAAGAALNTLGHGSDEELRMKVRQQAGMDQKTSKPGMGQYNKESAVLEQSLMQELARFKK